MGTDSRLEGELREAEAVQRDREAEMAPGPRVLTPRERAEAYVVSASECVLAEGGLRASAALRWLDEALFVLRAPDVVDGALEVRRLVSVALHASYEDENPEPALEALEELLDRPVRAAGVPVGREDFSPVTDELKAKRAAVSSVLRSSALQLGGISAGSSIPVETLDALIAAADTGV